MKLETIKKQIDKYEKKLERVDFWAKQRKDKFNLKLDSLKERLNHAIK